MIAATFEQARSIVAHRFGPQHRPSEGTYMVAEYGHDGGGLWHVIHGSSSYINATDIDDVLMDPIETFVFKDTGEVVQLPYIEVMAELDQMTPVGPWPGRVA